MITKEERAEMREPLQIKCTYSRFCTRMGGHLGRCEP